MSDRAGTPAQESDLIDVRELVEAYYSRVPDMSDPAQRVVFGTSGHRGSSLDGAFTETHIAATTQAIVDYRTAHGGFRSVDDLRRVEGIGDAKFAQLKDRVTV